MNAFIRWFGDLELNDVAVVGGKNASLGETLLIGEDAAERAMMAAPPVFHAATMRPVG